MLDWFNDSWRRINRARQQGRLPHALLINAPAGTGKHLFARHLASALLCEQTDTDGQTCGHCPACGWLDAGTHPDLLELAPDEKGKAIKVDQVRSFCTDLAMSSHGGRYKVAIIHPADAMNVNAANSLLKTLEEPTDNTMLILLTASSGRLPATIRSRCQQLTPGLPDEKQGIQWLVSTGMKEKQAVNCLQIAAGAPLSALAVFESGLAEVHEHRLDQLEKIATGALDPISVAKEWYAESMQETLDWWRTWLQDLIRWQVAGQQPTDASAAHKLQRSAETVDCRFIYELQDRVIKASNMFGSGLNQQLLMEDLLISWARLAQQAGSRSARKG